MPAAAVIPAPKAYTNAVAVKKLVVGFRAEGFHRAGAGVGYRGSAVGAPRLFSDSTHGIQPSPFIHGNDWLWKPP